MMRKIVVIRVFIGECISLFAAIRHFSYYIGFINKLFSNLMITPDKEINFWTSRKINLLVQWTRSFNFLIRMLICAIWYHLWAFNFNYSSNLMLRVTFNTWNFLFFLKTSGCADKSTTQLLRHHCTCLQELVHMNKTNANPIQTSLISNFLNGHPISLVTDTGVIKIS